MKKNSILLILALGMMSGGFYNDTFAAAPNKLQFTDNQQRKLIKDQVKKLINDTEVLTQEKVGRPLWINLHTENGILTIPSKYIAIERGAFCDMTNIEHVVMSPNVRTISGRLFECCGNLKSIDLQNVKSISEYAFYRCVGLTSITIPDSVASIGKWAFRGCTRLTSVTIPDSVTSICRDAFDGCCNKQLCFHVPSENMKNYLSEHLGIDKCKINVDITPSGNAWWWDLDDNKHLDIPDSVTQIEKCMFAYRSDIKSITIPNRIESIGKYAFLECSGLTSITIPDSVKSIGNNAFRECSKLTSITIPDSVQSIAEWAFFKCKGLTSVTIPKNIKPLAKRILYKN